MIELTMQKDISLYMCACVCMCVCGFVYAISCLLAILDCKTLNPKPTIVCQRPKG
jgi:hypothetical protein